MKAFVCAAALTCVAVSVAAQTPATPRPAAASAKFVPPKTAWGEPDLQGLYSNKTITPLERPAQFAGQAVLTDDEIADLESRAASRSVDNGRA